MAQTSNLSFLQNPGFLAAAKSALASLRIREWEEEEEEEEKEWYETPAHAEVGDVCCSSRTSAVCEAQVLRNNSSALTSEQGWP